MAAHVAHGNATRTLIRARVEHVFAAQKCRLGLIARTRGIVRAPASIGSRSRPGFEEPVAKVR